MPHKVIHASDKQSLAVLHHLFVNGGNADFVDDNGAMLLQHRVIGMIPVYQKGRKEPICWKVELEPSYKKAH